MLYDPYSWQCTEKIYSQIQGNAPLLRKEWGVAFFLITGFSVQTPVYIFLVCFFFSFGKASHLGNVLMKFHLHFLFVWLNWSRILFSYFLIMSILGTLTKSNYLRWPLISFGTFMCIYLLKYCKIPYKMAFIENLIQCIWWA